MQKDDRYMLYSLEIDSVWRDLEPLPNGFHALAGSFAQRSGAIRSGRKVSGSGPHTFGSRCNAGMRTLSLSPALHSYLPPTIVSWTGATVNAYV
jgi:hypothetical protein